MGAVIASYLALRQLGVVRGDAFTVPFHPYPNGRYVFCDPVRLHPLRDAALPCGRQLAP